MKKLILAVVAMCLVGSMVFAGGAKEKNASGDKISDAQNLSWNELMEKAKAETGEFNAYGNTSRIAAAMKNFVAKYGSELGLTEATAVGSKMNDSEIYTTLANEFASVNNAKGASMVMIQDGATLVLYREQSKMLLNYVPKSLNGKVGADDLVPLVQQYINKLFMWNTVGNNVPKISNVWQVTEPAMKNMVYFKNPRSEQVNMNFLIMLTNDKWSKALEQAYKDYYGKAIDLGNYKNAGYKWVAEFLGNANFSINSDTTIAQNLSKPENAGHAGLFVLSKLRDSSVTTENLQVAAWDKDASGKMVKVNPFAGFMYPMYCQLAANAPRPYTAMLFIEYLMTEEGFKPWSSMGAYSSNNEISVTSGDEPLSFWTDILVIEDPEYIRANKAAVVDFVSGILK